MLQLRVRQAILLWFLFAFTQIANGQLLGDRPVAQAHSIPNAPVMDGDVLNDAVWTALPPFGGLTQVQPKAGQVASESTDIRIAYDHSTFYVSVIML